jgi:hypothetical protein
MGTPPPSTSIAEEKHVETTDSEKKEEEVKFDPDDATTVVHKKIGEFGTLKQ